MSDNRTKILAGDTKTIGALATRIRRLGGRHRDVIEAVQDVFRDAGIPIPEARDIDAWLE